LCFGSGAEMSAHFFCLVVLDRTGVRFLFGDSDFDQDIENRFAFDF
jgi:hypothetical protein